MALVKMIRKGEIKNVDPDKVAKMLKENWTFYAGKLVVKR